MANNFDVVISGISGRFPECDDVNTFKEKLYSGDSSDFITTDQRKWKNGFKLRRYHDEEPIPQATGKYTNPDEFDYRVFGFHQEAAKCATVLNRKGLEVAYEAIIDAGINPSSLSGANIGVFMSSGIGETDTDFLRKIISGRMYMLGIRCMGPNRISFALNLSGPSLVIDTDPLGTVDALKLAKTMVQDGSIEAAIVVAVNHINKPHLNYLYRYLNFLSAEEFCRSFDENANGFVRSESSVALYLQREQDAKRNYAKINFCDLLYEGLLPHTLLGYDEEYLRSSLLKIYERNGGGNIAKDLAFLELTGSAVKNLDTMESNAVADVLFKWRTNSLPVGSIKSIVGHTESSSPLVSLLKIIFAFESKTIVPNKNFSQPNENIRAFRENQFQVINKTSKLSGDFAAVNTIGLFGTVNHVVLQRNCKESEDRILNESSLPRLLLLSGRTVESLQSVFEKINSDLKDVNAISMVNDVFSSYIPSHVIRGFTILSSDGLFAPWVEERGDKKRPICFVFSGMGSQWNGMGKQLMNLPVFADVIKQCDAVLRPRSIDIYDIILSDDPTMFDNITMSFVAIICMQIALFEVLKQLKIEPNIILGHSVGENGCAYADGCLTLEQAVLSSLARGTVSRTTKSINGMMAAIGIGYKNIKDHLPKEIEVGCHNSATSCTISGPVKDVNNYVRKLKKQNVFVKAVNVSNIAYHSSYIKALAFKLQEVLKQVIPNPKKRSAKWISTSVPEDDWSLPLAQTGSAEYFANNALKPVLFEEASRHIPKNAIVIEIAPHGLLQAILKRALPATCTNISLTLRSSDSNNLNTLLLAIGRLYVAGCDPAVNNLYPPMEYPVPRGTPSISPYCTWFHGDCDKIQAYRETYFPVPLSREKIVVRINENSEFGFLKNHQINGETVIPASFFLYLVWHMLSIYKNVKMDDFPVVYENIYSHRNVKISITKPRVFNVEIQGSGSFQVLSRAMFDKKDSKVVLTGKIELIQNENESPENTHNFTRDCKTFEYTEDYLNKILREAGFQLGKCFQSLKNLSIKYSESTGNIQWDGNWITLLDAALKFQMFSDIRQSKLCDLHHARRISISPSNIGSTSLGSKISCYYNKFTKQFLCNGIEMYDVKWKVKNPQYTNKSPSLLKLRKLKFISYNNPALRTCDEFLELCLQIATEDFQTTNEADLNLNICDITKQLFKSVKNSNCIRNFRQVSFKDLDTLPSEKLSENEKLFLIVEDDQFLAYDHLASDIFVLLIAPKQGPSTKIWPKFTPLLSQNFSGKTFCLLKKNLDSVPEIRIENSDYLLPLADENKGTKTEVIIRTKLNSSNLSLMLSRKRHSKSRYLFVSDTTELSSGCKSRVASKAIYNLPISVLKDQDWGTYRYLQTPEISSVDKITTDNQRFNNIQIDSINAACIRCDCSDYESNHVQSNSEVKLSGIEYSGWNKAGEKIMGLASTCSSRTVAKMDPILQWKVPDGWGLTEAVTVPAVYTHVYNVMEIIDRPSPFGERPCILIITDSQNVFAESLISVCTERSLTIYCALPDEENAKDLKMKIPKLNESNIIINTNNCVDINLLLKTKGRGANIVVNFSSDFRNISQIMSSKSIRAAVIETVERNMDESNKIGMWAFGNSSDFYAIPCRITHFLSLWDDRKIHLQNAIKQGIEDGFVKPVLQKAHTTFFRGLMDEQTDLPSTKYISKSQTPSDIGLKTHSPDLKFVANRSYIIIAGSGRDNTWMEIIQWLRERDAEHFVVVVENIPTHPRISAQINNWLRNEKITISFHTLNELTSFDHASRLVDETTKLAPIDSIFFVHMESSSNMIDYLDNATKSCKGNVKFISLFAGGVEEMEMRHSKGRPSFVFHGEKFPGNLPKVLTDFEEMLLTYEPDNNQSCLYEILENSNISDQLTPLRLVLPKSIDDLEQIGRNISDDIKFVEMASRCARMADCRGVYPIFVIPGLHALALESFCKSLMYPVFCASLTENASSVETTVFKLHKHLNVIQKAGPVTIIGETWNAAVAIELSSLIKKSGRDFKVFILEGNISEWKNIISTFSLMETHQFDEVLNEIYGDKIQEYLQPRNLLKSGGNNCAINRDHNEEQEINSAHVHRCLRVLKKQISNAHSHNYADSMIENTVFFFRQYSRHFSLVLADSSDVIFIQENNYDKFIRSPVIRKIINKNAQFAW